MSNQVHCVCIANKTVVLAQSAANQKHEAQFLRDIEGMLRNFADKDNMRTCQEQPDMTFAVMVQGGITYIAFAAPNVKRAQAYGMLGDIQSEFSQKFKPEATKFVQKLQMQKEFGSVISRCMGQVQKYGGATQQLQKDLDEVKGLVMENVNAVMKRAQQLETIATDAEELKDNAHDFLDQTDQLKKQMLCKRVGIIVGISIAALAVLAAIIIPIVIKMNK
jgi:vesicle-associated membrane protein 7